MGSLEFPQESSTMLERLPPKKSQVILELEALSPQELYSNLQHPRVGHAVVAFNDAAYYYEAIALRMLCTAEAPTTSAGGMFIAFADFQKDRWDWQAIKFTAPLDGQSVQTITVNVPKHIYPYSDEGHIYVALAVYDQKVELQKLTLIADEAAPPPLGVTASRGTVDSAIRLSWVDPEVSYSPEGAPSFPYQGVEIQFFDSVQGWVTIAAVDRNVTEYIHYNPGDTWPFQYRYRLRTLTADGAGRYGSEVTTGYPGKRPIAGMDIYVAAPTLYLSGGYSRDPDSSNSITEYLWNISYADDPNFSYEINSSELTIEYVIKDMTQVHRIDLRVKDNEGLLSEPAPYFLWAPDNGCLVDDESMPDPGEPGTIGGQGPGTYTAQLSFKILCGNPNWKLEIDTWFSGVFGANDGVPVITFAPDFGFEGSKSVTTNIPAAQPSGEYYFAVRATDSSGDQQIYMWPNRVELAP